jgi:hypothetical protein
MAKIELLKILRTHFQMGVNTGVGCLFLKRGVRGAFILQYDHKKIAQKIKNEF